MRAASVEEELGYFDAYVEYTLEPTLEAQALAASLLPIMKLIIAPTAAPKLSLDREDEALKLMRPDVLGQCCVASVVIRGRLMGRQCMRRGVDTVAKALHASFVAAETGPLSQSICFRPVADMGMYEDDDSMSPWHTHMCTEYTHESCGFGTTEHSPFSTGPRSPIPR